MIYTRETPLRLSGVRGYFRGKIIVIFDGVVCIGFNGKW